jgi:acetoin utilization protein AcuB
MGILSRAICLPDDGLWGGFVEGRVEDHALRFCQPFAEKKEHLWPYTHLQRAQRRQKVGAMLIKDIMTPQPLTLTIENTVSDALSVLKSRKDIRHLPVTDDEELVGIVSERDLRSILGYLTAMSERGRVAEVDLLHYSVDRIMTRGVFTVRSDDPLIKAARLFGERKIGALPVVDGKHLAGIVSYTDLLNRFVIPVMLSDCEEVALGGALPLLEEPPC